MAMCRKCLTEILGDTDVDFCSDCIRAKKLELEAK